MFTPLAHFALLWRITVSQRLRVSRVFGRRKGYDSVVPLRHTVGTKWKISSGAKTVSNVKKTFVV